MALTKHDLKSLEFAVNGLLMKIIFRSNNSEIIAECRYFQFNLPREEQKKKTKFEEKYNRCDACYLRVSWLGSGLFSVFLLYLFYHYCYHYRWRIKILSILHFGKIFIVYPAGLRDNSIHLAGNRTFNDLIRKPCTQLHCVSKKCDSRNLEYLVQLRCNRFTTIPDIEDYASLIFGTHCTSTFSKQYQQQY